jgi:hypothetical protein
MTDDLQTREQMLRGLMQERDMEQTDTATAIRTQQRNHRLAAAMDHLLHDLRRFMKAYPMRGDAEMPDHEMVWVDLPDRGAARVILDAIKSNPALWIDALPSNVCIVPRASLETIASLSPDHIDYLTALGGNMVAAQAAQYEDDQANPSPRSI